MQEKIRLIKKARLFNDERILKQRLKIIESLNSVCNIDGTPYISTEWMKKIY